MTESRRRQSQVASRADNVNHRQNKPHGAKKKKKKRKEKQQQAALKEKERGEGDVAGRQGSAHLQCCCCCCCVALEFLVNEQEKWVFTVTCVLRVSWLTHTHDIYIHTRHTHTYKHTSHTVTHG